jgi:2'-5' RNA ligase
MKERIRTFVAVELSAGIRAALAASARGLQEHGADVKWVAEESTHLTVKFLGDVRRASIPEVLTHLEEAGAAIEPFAMEVSGLSFFPRPERPKVVAAGIPQPAASALSALAAKTDAALSALGFPPERRAFRAHITLGRVKSPRGVRGLADALLTASGEPFGRQLVTEMVLFMSELSRSGPTYTLLGRAGLRGGSDTL